MCIFNCCDCRMIHFFFYMRVEDVTIWNWLPKSTSFFHPLKIYWQASVLVTAHLSNAKGVVVVFCAEG